MVKMPAHHTAPVLYLVTLLYSTVICINAAHEEIYIHATEVITGTRATGQNENGNENGKL